MNEFVLSFSYCEFVSNCYDRRTEEQVEREKDRDGGRDGEMERWRDGEMEGWRDGDSSILLPSHCCCIRHIVTITPGSQSICITLIINGIMLFLVLINHLPYVRKLYLTDLLFIQISEVNNRLTVRNSDKTISQNIFTN